MPLSAKPTLIVVDPNSSVPGGQTEVSYAATVGTTARIWWRLLGGDGSGVLTGADWEKLPLEPPVVDCTPGGCEFVGKFKRNLLPGQICQVRLYGDDTDPNFNDETPPDDEVFAIAVRKQPESIALIESMDRSMGGTWFKKFVKAVQPTFCTLEVSDQAPVTGADGMPRFVRPLHIVVDDANAILKIDHQLLVESVFGSLLPGNEFHALVRVFDELGNWDVRAETFTTLPRKLTIDYDELHIVNDGSFGDTEGSFEIRVWEGISFNLVDLCAFGDEDFPISDSPDPGHEAEEHIPLAPPRCPRFVFGPQQITPATNTIVVYTEGKAHNAFEPDVASGSTEIPIPEGINETVTNRPFTVRAVPFEPDTDEFTYDVKGRFSVVYGFGI